MRKQTKRFVHRLIEQYHDEIKKVKHFNQNNNFLQDIFKMYLEESGGISGEFKCATLQTCKRVTVKSGNRTLTVHYNPKTDKGNIYFKIDEEVSGDKKERVRTYLRELYH